MTDFDGVSGWDHPAKMKKSVLIMIGVWLAVAAFLIVYSVISIDESEVKQRSAAAYHPLLDDQSSQVVWEVNQ